AVRPRESATSPSLSSRSSSTRRAAPWAQTGGASPASTSEAPRIYTTPHKAMATGELPKPRLDVPDNLFQDVPDVDDSVRRESEEKKRTRETQRATSESRLGTGATGAVPRARSKEGSGWYDAADSSGAGILQAFLGTAAVVALSLVVVFATSWAVDELDYGKLAPWAIGRSCSLIAAALVVTLAVRRESFARIGFFPNPGGVVIGLVLGLGLGFLGANVAPIRGDGALASGVIIGVLCLQALSHELFFRGVVLRSLLGEFPSAIAAVALACAMYGTFYLSYQAVLQQTGFAMVYYSLLLFGFGVGGVLGWLYYRYKSVIPGILCYGLTLVLSFALSN
ncbi:MAG: CPBP family intramembrane metalloprotease, partial [Myxococcales bacterium]|nr:CPBP family intramembrane metalloprotease [Myxococcales bacterium]